jgi:hypothetical protein
MTKKTLSKEGGSITGDEFTVGGEGMKLNYDSKYPNFIKNQYGHRCWSIPR